MLDNIPKLTEILYNPTPDPRFVSCMAAYILTNLYLESTNTQSTLNSKETDSDDTQ